MGQKFKLHDTNVYNEQNRIDDIDIMKKDNFIQDSEKVNNLSIKYDFLFNLFEKYITFYFLILYIILQINLEHIFYYYIR